MTLEQAHKILNAVKAGMSYPLRTINEALHVTGDL